MFRKEEITFISGGESGTDLAFLQSAKYLDVSTKGYMPTNFKTEHGPKPEYQEEYQLQECFGGSRQRDILNVEESDVLIAFLLDKDDPNDPSTVRTMSTINCTRTGIYKHVLLLSPNSSEEEKTEEKIEEKIKEKIKDKLRIKIKKHQMKRLKKKNPNKTSKDLIKEARAIKEAKGIKEAKAKKAKKAKDNAPSEAVVMIFDAEADRKPVIVFWNITNNKLPIYKAELTDFLMKHRPRNLMVSGPVRSTYPEIENMVVLLMIQTMNDLFQPEESLKGKPTEFGDKTCDNSRIPHRYKENRVNRGREPIITDDSSDDS